MFKILIFCLVSIVAQAEASEESSDIIIFKKFIPTSFGIKSRTIDNKDADAVIKEIKDFKIANPRAEFKVEILTCTSDYELPQTTITDKKIDEHIKLAQARNAMILEEIQKTLLVTIHGEAKNCGPTFSKDDLNDRFVTKDSKTFADRFEALKKMEGFLDQLKEEALIDDPAELIGLYPTIFLAKFKPFQGIRLILRGSIKKVNEVEKTKAKPSGKSQ